MRKIIVFILYLFSTSMLLAWTPWPLPMDSVDSGCDVLRYSTNYSLLVSTGKFAPFWMSTNTDGVVSISPIATHLRAFVEKKDTRSARWWDYSYGVDLLGGVDTYQWRAQIVRLYAHARLWCFDVTAGIKPFDMGNQDYELSSGGFLFSRNAPSFPRVSVGIDKYTAFPFSYGYLELKGGVTHGWFVDNVGVKNPLLHHKYIGVRLGGSLPVRLNYEFHHAAQWGGVSDEYGELGSSLRDWWTVFKASSGGVIITDQLNAMGNHIGSQMLGVDVRYTGWYINAYWQSIFEDGPIRYIWNAKNVVDGLWGIAIKQSHWKFIDSFVYEFFATTDQSGTCHDIDGIIFGGADNYFTNIIYSQGWSNFGCTIGNPFITSPIYSSTLSTMNSRTFTHHIALKGDIKGFQYLIRYSHANNFGKYYQTVRRSVNNGIYASVCKLVPQAWNLNFGVALACDVGTQFGNSFGAMFTISRSGIIWESKK